jgi:hypothetical protein
MKLEFILIVNIIAFSCHQVRNNKNPVQSSEIQTIYTDCKLSGNIPFEVFELAMNGLQKNDVIRNKKIITIIDYSKPSTVNRFLVIDLEKRQILYKTLVAHGKNSGEINAVSFSNDPESLKSCLGFFVTAETYNGKNGYTLSLDGLEPGINDNARNRAIVIHGADYAGTAYLKKYGRLGRSWGCPALPGEISREIIDRIKNGSCVFIYGNDPVYMQRSKIHK